MAAFQCAFPHCFTTNVTATAIAASFIPSSPLHFFTVSAIPPCLCDTFPKFGDLFSHRALVPVCSMVSPDTGATGFQGPYGVTRHRCHWVPGSSCCHQTLVPLGSRVLMLSPATGFQGPHAVTSHWVPGSSCCHQTLVPLGSRGPHAVTRHWCHWVPGSSFCH